MKFCETLLLLNLLPASLLFYVGSWKKSRKSLIFPQLSFMPVLSFPPEIFLHYIIVKKLGLPK